MEYCAFTLVVVSVVPMPGIYRDGTPEMEYGGASTRLSPIWPWFVSRTPTVFDRVLRFSFLTKTILNSCYQMQMMSHKTTSLTILYYMLVLNI